MALCLLLGISQMIKKVLKTILLKDIFDALFVGIRCCFKKPVTKKLSEIKKVNKFRKALEVDTQKCIRCGLCEGICPNKSIKLSPNKYPVFDEKRCCFCDLCRKACPRSAIDHNPKITT